MSVAPPHYTSPDGLAILEMLTTVLTPKRMLLWYFWWHLAWPVSPGCNGDLGGFDHTCWSVHVCVWGSWASERRARIFVKYGVWCRISNRAYSCSVKSYQGNDNGGQVGGKRKRGINIKMMSVSNVSWSVTRSRDRITIECAPYM